MQFTKHQNPRIIPSPRGALEIVVGPEAARLGAAMRAFQTDLSEVAHAKGAALRERLQD